MADKYVKTGSTVLPYRRRTLNVHHSFSAPSTAEFELIQDYTGDIPAVGAPIAVYRRDDVKQFSGTVDDVEWSGFAEVGGNLQIRVRCVGYNNRMYIRTTRNRTTGARAEYHSFAGKVNTSGTAVTLVAGDKFTPYLVGKAVSIGSGSYVVSSVTGPNSLVLTATAGTQTNAPFSHTTYTKDAVIDLITNFLDGEGFTYDGTSIPNNGAPIKSYSFDPPIPVAQALQQLLDGNPDYYLYVDPNQKVWYAPRTAVNAPVNFTDSTSADKRGININRSREDVRNVELSVLNWDVIDEVEETVTGDGASTSWFLTNAPYQISSAQVNGQDVNIRAVAYNAYYSGRVNINAGGTTATRVDGSYFDSSMIGELIHIGSETAAITAVNSNSSVSIGIGITGPQTNASFFVDLTATGTADFYFLQNTTSLWADPAFPVMTSGDSLVLRLKPYTANCIETKDATAIANRAAIEVSGTGRYEEVIDRSGLLQDSGAAQTEAANSISRLKDDLCKVTLETLDPGYAPGQVVLADIDDRKVNETLFIDEVTYNDLGTDAVDWMYSLVCSSVARRITSADILRQLFGISGGIGATSGSTPVTTPAYVDAPNATNATITPVYGFKGTQAVYGFSGTINLPIDYTHLKFLHVKVTLPTGAEEYLCPPIQPGVSVSSVAFTGTATWNQDIFNNVSHTITIYAENEDGVLAPSPLTKSVTVTKPQITSLTSSQQSRWSGLDGSVHAVVRLDIDCNRYHQWVSIESVSPQYGRTFHGVFSVTSSSFTLDIGGIHTGTILFPPTTASSENVVFYAALGSYDSQVALSGVSGVSSVTQSVSAPGVYGATGSSSVTSPTVTSVKTTGGAKAKRVEFDVGLPLADADFMFARMTLQTGRYVSTVWTPGGANPGTGFAGVVGTPIGDYAGPKYSGYTENDHSHHWITPASIASSGLTTVHFVDDLRAIPADDVNDTLKYRLYIASRKDDGSGGTKVQQSTFPGSVNEYDVTLTLTDGDISRVSIANAKGSMALTPTTDGLEASWTTGGHTKTLKVYPDFLLLEDGAGLELRYTGGLFSLNSGQFAVNNAGAITRIGNQPTVGDYGVPPIIYKEKFSSGFAGSLIINPAIMQAAGVYRISVGIRTTWVSGAGSGSTLLIIAGTNNGHGALGGFGSSTGYVGSGFLEFSYNAGGLSACATVYTDGTASTDGVSPSRQGAYILFEQLAAWSGSMFGYSVTVEKLDDY